jgi:capsular exopolysaccharide synthesis family protein
VEIRDYVGMLRRGWPAIVLITVAVLGLTAVYLQLAPKRYEAHAVVYVSPKSPETFNDLVQGGSFASNVVTTYAEMIDSAVVLGPAAASLHPQRSVAELNDMVSADVRPETRLIDIVVNGSNTQDVTAIANAVAGSASRIIPGLDAGPNGASLVRVQQLRQAVEPTKASSPVVKRTLALGLIVGLCLGLGVTIAAQALDTRLRRVDDVRALTSLPLLAVLPPPSRAERRGMVVRDQPRGSAAEAYRTLRTNMRFREATDRRSFVFASVADDREGAQLPVNLSWTLAQAGQRVLLVDLDLRGSTVGDTLGIDSHGGMADVLMGQVTVAEVLHGTEHPNLDVVLSGTLQPSPSELLTEPALGGVLQEMEQNYDYVILHVPPVLTYTDAALISVSAGGTFIAVAAGRTRAQELSTALAALANVRIKPLGLVLTTAPKSALEHGTVALRRHRPRLGQDWPPPDRVSWTSDDESARRAAER